MGFFTWRAAKGAKREVQGLRGDMARQNRQAKIDRHQARIAKITEDAKLLPEEGRAEINALRAAHYAKSTFKRNWTLGRFYREQEAIIRRYKAPKGYEEV